MIVRGEHYKFNNLPGEFSIVELDSKDIEQKDGVLIALFEDAFGSNATFDECEFFGIDPSKISFEDESFATKYAKGECSRIFAAVTYENGKKRIIGYASDVTKKRDDATDNYILGHSFMLDNLVVLESYRHQGVGSKLIDTFINGMDPQKQYQFIDLNVNLNNKEAINLYNKKGFKIFCVNNYNRQYCVMVKQRNDDLQLLGDVCAACIKQVKKNSSVIEVCKWFDSIENSMKLETTESFVSDEKLFNYFNSDKPNKIDLFDAAKDCMIEYYAFSKNKDYPFEAYVIDRVNSYYDSDGKTSATYRQFAKSSGKLDQDTIGPQVIQILKCARLTMRDEIARHNESVFRNHDIKIGKDYKDIDELIK